jgi:DNA-binding LacI/PurR family transcriptional regulator
MDKKKATVYTVAEHASVSIATVSRTLAGNPKVAPETRQRVLQAIEDLNFEPNPSARRLAYQKTDTIALVFPDISGPYYSAVIRGVEREAGNYDYNVLIYGTHGKEDGGHFFRSLISKVDGMIIMARSIGEERLVSLHRQGLPLALLSRPVESITCDTVAVDNQGGAANAAAHLISHGHRRIALISGPQDSPASQERMLGYRKAIRDAGLSLPTDLVSYGNFQSESGYAAMGQILSTVPRPSAVLAANDEMALGAMEFAREQGFQIPDDMAIIGFDDIQVAALLRPALTTVRQPMERLGERAFQLLNARLNGNGTDAYQNEILPTRLIVRHTCGCPV